MRSPSRAKRVGATGLPSARSKSVGASSRSDGSVSAEGERCRQVALGLDLERIARAAPADGDIIRDAAAQVLEREGVQPVGAAELVDLSALHDLPRAGRVGRVRGPEPVGEWPRVRHCGFREPRDQRKALRVRRHPRGTGQQGERPGRCDAPRPDPAAPRHRGSSYVRTVPRQPPRSGRSPARRLDRSAPSTAPRGQDCPSRGAAGWRSGLVGPSCDAVRAGRAHHAPIDRAGAFSGPGRPRGTARGRRVCSRWPGAS